MSITRVIANGADEDRWLDQAAEMYMQNDEEFVSCPDATCSWGCFMIKTDCGYIFTCQLCNMRYCISCQVPMHEDMTCAQYIARNERQERDNINSVATIKSTTKECPKCHANIEKNRGCDHMRCEYLGTVQTTSANVEQAPDASTSSVGYASLTTEDIVASMPWAIAFICPLVLITAIDCRR